MKSRGCKKWVIFAGTLTTSIFSDAKVTVVDSKYRRSPLIQGGLEIPVTVFIEIDSTSKNVSVLERYKKLVNKNYEEPNNGSFDDCTKDILRDLLEDSNSDEDEQLDFLLDIFM